MKYPLRRAYHGIRAHQHWMRDILKYRKLSNARIARLEKGVIYD